MTVVGKLTFFFRIGARATAQTGAVITAIPVIPAILARAGGISIGVVFALLGLCELAGDGGLAGGSCWLSPMTGS